jgi:protein-S-isoprenylcysteine O-methyltransferase Ste14
MHFLEEQLLTGSGNRQDDDGQGREWGKAELKLPALPPIIFFGPVFLGALIHVFIWNGEVIGGTIGLVIGLMLITVGVLLMYWSWITMRRFGEHPEPGVPTETLVTTGPFKRTRNPIYSGFLLISAGFAISLNAMAILVSVFFGVALLTALVIRREEAYLLREFGDIYTKYENRTGRWI